MAKRKILTTAVVAALASTAIGLPNVHAGTLAFTEAPVPTTDADKRKVAASPEATVDGADYEIGYDTLLRIGDTPLAGTNKPWSDNIFGALIDENGNFLRNADGSVRTSGDSGMDHNSFTEAYGKLWLISQKESPSTRTATSFISP
jgi:hypothetical protein